ncbi:flagellar biosynthetic protein FliO [uncultured Devosia sp.]|uniref:flagellar biosynthetic protein FliO n=1 Tax=uncultured Devosia sp. TaxID=211434 RepID=UPI0035CBB7A9
MQFISSLFGGEGGSLVTALFALGVVLVLIVLAVWLLKLVFNASGSIARGRDRRLSVIDTLALDPRRQLLIIRRDNVEHLILTGGPQDVVVETGIPIQEPPVTQTGRRPLPVVPRRPVPARPAPVAAPVPVPEAPPSPATAIERLRDFGRPAAVPGPKSLRHTGLMRQVPVVEAPVQRPQNSDQLDHDSAKEVEGHPQAGTTELDEHDAIIRREERKADGF